VTKPPAFAFSSVDKTYVLGPPWNRREVHAIRNVSFTIAAGETLALVGRSGSGKTTISKLCLGLIAPTSGEIRLNGAPLAQPSRSMRGQFSVVLQNPGASLNPRFTVARAILEPARLSEGVGLRNGRERVLALLEKVGLPAHYADRYPHELSGGQKQRVAIARALCTSPRFVVFDEAVSALDISVQTQVLNLIMDLQAETGFSALFITHDFRAARYVGHRIGVMWDGVLHDIIDRATAYCPTEDAYLASLRE
jgi:ABC-type glutathione transport system ATPase component